MTVTKILEQTLSAGSTSVSFTDADIPNSLIRVYSSNSDLIPVSRILSGNTLTVTYEAQASAIDVAVEIVKAGLDIVDDVTSTDINKALSAKQGKLLKDDVNTLSGNIDTLSNNLDTLTDRVDNLDIPYNITDLNDVEINNIQSGQIIGWNGSKFVNVDQSGGLDHSYSTSEKVIGTWINNKPLYQLSINIANVLFPANSRTQLPLSNYVSNIDNIVYAEAVMIDELNRTLSCFQVSSFSSYAMSFYVDKNDGLIFSRGSGGDFTSDVVATIRYTKTTD